MGKVIEIRAAKTQLGKPPANLWKLRWRLKTQGGPTIASAWTPETRYPSITQTMLEFADRIETVYVDGINLRTGDQMTFLTCPGYAFLELSYKGMMAAETGASFVAGIEVVDRENNRYLVLRDGTVYAEERTAHVSNDD